MFLPPSATTAQLQPLANIPPNLAGLISPELQAKIMRWMYENYIFPQILERQQFEPLWDKLLDMYRIQVKSEDLKWNRDDTKKKERMEEVAMSSNKPNRAQVSDTVVFDAVDRLKNLNHFISWKDGKPIQFNIPDHYSSSKEGTFYHPLANRIQSANALLQWNIDEMDVYRNHLILSGHHYTYGCCFVYSELEYKISQVPQRTPIGMKMVPQLEKIGVSFDPISIRRIWLNYRIPVYSMELQPCPFLFEEMPRFAVLNNPYDPVMNPFGYLNLDKLPTPQWLFQQSEMDSLRAAVYDRLGVNVGTEILAPEFSIEGKWKFFPMLPFDPNTGEWITRKDGTTPVPLTRYIVEWFGVNLRQGEMFPIRIQPLFDPTKKLPIYASQHMPDMDSGAYSLSVGEVLQSHYEQICTAKNQWLDNKNLINNPPWWSQIGTPTPTQDPNTPGAHIKVTGPNDFGWRTIPDATSTTVQFLQYLSQQAKTSSKATEAILGQAMGGRTSATEAQNVFQAAMSGVTTDINIFNHDIMGGYAERVWAICGMWFPMEVIRAITGQYGDPLTIEDLNTRVALKWDVGSTYIESIVLQQHLQYAIQGASTSPVLNQGILWRQYFEVIKAPQLQEAVMDDGFSEQVAEATEQSIETYLGQQVIVDPTQNHQIALEVKSRYLKDIKSNWNQDYGMLPDATGKQTRAQNLAQQCALHQQFLQIELQQQLAQQQLMQHAQVEQQQAAKQTSDGNQENPGRMNRTAGQAAQ